MRRQVPPHQGGSTTDRKVFQGPASGTRDLHLLAADLPALFRNGISALRVKPSRSIECGRRVAAQPHPGRRGARVFRHQRRNGFAQILRIPRPLRPATQQRHGGKRAARPLARFSGPVPAFPEIGAPQKRGKAP